MLAEKFSIADDFPAVSYDEWRAQVEADLQVLSFEKKLVTHTYEGIDLQPIYTRRDHPADDDPLGFPGLAPFVRGTTPLGAVLTGWDLRQEFSEPDPATANRAIIDDVAGGVTSLLLRLDSAARHGFDPDDAAAGDFAGEDGLMAYTVDDYDAALNDVSLDRISIALDAGAAFLPAAAMLVALWQRRGVAFDCVQGAFNADPWGVLSATGSFPLDAAATHSQLADLAVWTSLHLPHVTSIGIDTSVYHHAGATASQDLAFGLATAVDYLRALTAAGLSIDAAAQQFLFRISLGTHHFLAIAKLRAARMLWCRVVTACGGSAESGGMRIHARLSNRVLTERDPYVNILRNTVGVFAAGLGGAEAITSIPFDHLAGTPSSFSRRVARNSALILLDEAHLNRVVDPAGGSWFLDKVTEQIAAESWSIFQEIERRGGIVAVLQNGWVAEQIDAAFAPRARDIARRKAGITGVSEFPNVSEEALASPQPDVATLVAAATDRTGRSRRASKVPASFAPTSDRTELAVAAARTGASIGQLASALGFHQSPITIAPLPVRCFAEPFEQLRDASDAWQAAHGSRPRVFLVNLGSVAHHTARATFSKNFFEAGGFEVRSSEGLLDADAAAKEYAKSGSHIAVICSSDKLYADMLPQVAAKLKSAARGPSSSPVIPAPMKPLGKLPASTDSFFSSAMCWARCASCSAQEGVLTP